MEITLTYRVNDPKRGQFEDAYNAFPNFVHRSGCRVITYLGKLSPNGKGDFAVVIDTVGLKADGLEAAVERAIMEAAVERAIMEAAVERAIMEAAIQSTIVDVINAVGGVAIGVPWRIEADSKNGYMIANAALKRFNHELKLGGLLSRLIGIYYESHVSQIVPERYRNPRLAVVPA